MSAFSHKLLGLYPSLVCIGFIRILSNQFNQILEILELKCHPSWKLVFEVHLTGIKTQRLGFPVHITAEHSFPLSFLLPL